jgi:hypothetical protein
MLMVPRYKQRQARRVQMLSEVRKPLKDQPSVQGYGSVLAATKPKKAPNAAAAQKAAAIESYRKEVAALTIQLAWRKVRRIHVLLTQVLKPLQHMREKAAEEDDKPIQPPAKKQKSRAQPKSAYVRC